MASSAVTYPPPPLVSDGPGDESFWHDYLKRVIDEDFRVIADWQKVLDTLLVYNGLFIGVLTAFIIQMSSLLQPSPGDATNKIIIAIYNHTIMMNATASLDLGQYVKGDDESDIIVHSSIFLLYTSLALSISVAAFALIISLWLIRYRQTLNETQLTIYERIRNRHEAYRTLMEWKLPTLIQMQPLTVLLALLIFATFICQSVQVVHPITSVVIYVIFAMISIFFLLTIPFHSPLSLLMDHAFRISSNFSIRIPALWLYAVVLIFAFIIMSKFRLTRFERILLIYLLAASVFAASPKKKPVQIPENPRLYSLPTLIYSIAIVIPIIFMILICARLSPPAINVASYSITSAAITILMLVRFIWDWTHGADEDAAKAEAVAWMIKTSYYHDLVTFQQAVKLARNSRLQYRLLKDILPVLDILITSIQPDQEEALSEEEKMYITLLAVLVDFTPCKAVFWRNRAAMEQPSLSDKLKEKLRKLRQGGCSHGDSMPTGSDCPRANATFILSKTDENDQNIV